MSNFGIGKVRYKPICSSEEMELEIKIPSANEVVKNMWNKLDDTEKGFINIMIDKNNKQDLEIERLKEENKKYNKWIESLNKDNHRLNNIIKEAREYIEIIVKNTPSSTRKDYANMLLIDYKKLLEILDKGE